MDKTAAVCLSFIYLCSCAAEIYAWVICKWNPAGADKRLSAAQPVGPLLEKSW